MAKATKVAVADGDYEKIVINGIDPFYTNPEFSRAADALLAAIHHYQTVVQGGSYDRVKALVIANKILESRP